MQVAGMPCEVIGDVAECAALIRALAAGPAAAVAAPKQIKSRRERVLYALRSLHAQRAGPFSLDEIVSTVLETFPDTQGRHLDQVVRDLANKTKWVERSHWGTFQLRNDQPDSTADRS